MGKQKIFISRRQAALLIPAVLIMLWVSFVLWERPAANQAVRVQFVCVTNVPGMAPQALFKITNLTEDQVLCFGHGWLDSGESATWLFCIPAGTGPWRVSVQWQRSDLSGFEEQMNSFRRRLEVAFGAPEGHRDAWLPLARVSHSPEIQR